MIERNGGEDSSPEKELIETAQDLEYMFLSAWQLLDEPKQIIAQASWNKRQKELYNFISCPPQPKIPESIEQILNDFPTATNPRKSYNNSKSPVFKSIDRFIIQCQTHWGYGDLDKFIGNGVKKHFFNKLRKLII